MIPFNKPYMTGRELDNIAQAHANAQLSGDGSFTKFCHAWLREHTGAHTALLTHSCTAALEMVAMLLDLSPGDEIIMPSFTFVSTANAFVLRGAVPVFVDIRPDTLNIDDRLIEGAITPRTRAICVVHYAGVACEMDAILAVAQRHGLAVVEDAAQGIFSSYKGRPLGTIGEMGCLSFHETKNVISGEGGALLLRDATFSERAEIIREKGTNRSRFFRGQVDKYTWVDVGSSYLPSELIAAFLAAQLDAGQVITGQRLAVWNRYHAAFQAHEQAGRARRPVVPGHCNHNAHMYYLLLPSLDMRRRFIEILHGLGIASMFHYIPLHSAPAGQHYGKTATPMSVTDSVSDCLVRLPLWVGLEQVQDRVIAAVDEALSIL